MASVDSFGHSTKKEDLFPERLRVYGRPVAYEKGARGVVYKMIPSVRHVTKVIECGDDGRCLSDALYELRVMRHLSGCPHAVQMVDSEVVSSDGNSTVYIVEECHTPLIKAYRRKPYTAVECVRVAAGVAQALISLRDAGVLYLDVKLANVFLTEEGEVCLGDFGCSMLTEDREERPGGWGTFDYMAPEVYADRNFSERSDIFSVGILLYKMLNGGLNPFVYRGHVIVTDYPYLVEEPFPSIETMSAEQNDVVAGALSRVCAYNPDDRTQTFEELEACLRSLEKTMKRMGMDALTVNERELRPSIDDASTYIYE